MKRGEVFTLRFLLHFVYVAIGCLGCCIKGNQVLERRLNFRIVSLGWVSFPYFSRHRCSPWQLASVLLREILCSSESKTLDSAKIDVVRRYWDGNERDFPCEKVENYNTLSKISLLQGTSLPSKYSYASTSQLHEAAASFIHKLDIPGSIPCASNPMDLA